MRGSELEDEALFSLFVVSLPLYLPRYYISIKPSNLFISLIGAFHIFVRATRKFCYLAPRKTEREGEKMTFSGERGEVRQRVFSTKDRFAFVKTSDGDLASG